MVPRGRSAASTASRRHLDARSARTAAGSCRRSVRRHAGGVCETTRGGRDGARADRTRGARGLCGRPEEFRTSASLRGRARRVVATAVRYQVSGARYQGSVPGTRHEGDAGTRPKGTQVGCVRQTRATGGGCGAWSLRAARPGDAACDDRPRRDARPTSKRRRALPDHASEVRRALERFQRRYRVLAIADAVMAAAVAAGLVVMSGAALQFRAPHAAAYAASGVCGRLRDCRRARVARVDRVARGAGHRSSDRPASTTCWSPPKKRWPGGRCIRCLRRSFSIRRRGGCGGSRSRLPASRSRVERGSRLGCSSRSAC